MRFFITICFCLYSLLWIWFWQSFWNQVLNEWLQHQWFSQFNEKSQKVEFKCFWQCIINIWKTAKYWQVVKLSWVKWTWTVTVWIQGWNWQLIDFWRKNTPIKSDSFTVPTEIQGQVIPENIPILIVIEWEIFWKNSSFSINKTNIFDAVSKYFELEPQTFYSINLRYWNFFWSTQSYIIFYVFFVFCLWYLYYKRKLNIKYITYLVVWLWILVFARQSLDYIKITFWSISEYNQSGNYWNLWDFYNFTDQIDKLILKDYKDGSQKCNIYMKCSQERPFCVHMKLVFVKPCETVEDITKSDYQIYYKSNPTQVWEMLYQANNNFIIKTQK